MFIAPMLCQIKEQAFDDAGWIFEHKLDGIRIIADKTGNQIRLWTRNKLDKSRQFPEITELIKRLPYQQIILDGEIVANASVKQFQAIQKRVQQQQSTEIAKLIKKTPVTYYVFDILMLNGKKLLKLPLKDRKALLDKINNGDSLKILPHIVKTGKALFAKAKRLGWEGIVAKKFDSVYSAGKRNRHWVKIKTHNNQELVIGGFTEGFGKVKSTFGSLIVGYYRQNKLVYAGEVGTGFTDSERKELKQVMTKLSVGKNPFGGSVKSVRKIIWVKPKLVVQIKFAEWTKDNILRQPVYLGLRTDKSAKQILKEG